MYFRVILSLIVDALEHDFTLNVKTLRKAGRKIRMTINTKITLRFYIGSESIKSKSTKLFGVSFATYDAQI